MWVLLTVLVVLCTNLCVSFISWWLIQLSWLCPLACCHSKTVNLTDQMQHYEIQMVQSSIVLTTSSCGRDSTFTLRRVLGSGNVVVSSSFTRSTVPSPPPTIIWHSVLVRHRWRAVTPGTNISFHLFHIHKSLYMIQDKSVYYNVKISSNYNNNNNNNHHHHHDVTDNIIW
jgi:hypothetical protein